MHNGAVRDIKVYNQLPTPSFKKSDSLPSFISKRATWVICTLKRANHIFALSISKNVWFARKLKSEFPTLHLTNRPSSFLYIYYFILKTSKKSFFHCHFCYFISCWNKGTQTVRLSWSVPEVPAPASFRCQVKQKCSCQFIWLAYWIFKCQKDVN